MIYQIFKGDIKLLEQGQLVFIVANSVLAIHNFRIYGRYLPQLAGREDNL